MKKFKPNKIWNDALNLIPGGNGLLSKRPYRFVPNFWPTYYKKCNGILVTDLNGKKYIDFSAMGIGTCSLGYSINEIDQFVIKNIKSGVNSTLNSINEVNLAKKILSIDKFADKVKFTRGGGEAMSLAIRIARAKNKRENIFFSGYHGWHDWYLSANLQNKKSLDTYLLPNLPVQGVPKGLKNTAIPINLKKISNLNFLYKSKNIAAVVVELARENYENHNVIKEIYNFCKKKNICFIVDEITTGWRGEIGGEYKKYKIKPDLVVYGKAMGNGYAISCVVGTNNYMKCLNNTFASSTAWTEKVGFAAAESTIDFFKKNKVNNHINQMGDYIIKEWKNISKKSGVKIKIGNYKAIPSFKFDYKNEKKISTIFTYEMLKKKYLATNSVFLSFSHKKKDIDKYLKNFEIVFSILQKYLKDRKGYKFIENKRIN